MPVPEAGLGRPAPASFHPGARPWRQSRRPGGHFLDIGDHNLDIDPKLASGTGVIYDERTPEALLAGARRAIAAFNRGKGEVWVPGTLRFVFAAFRMLPRAVWRKMPR